jgi:hypothetical protein
MLIILSAVAEIFRLIFNTLIITIYAKKLSTVTTSPFGHSSFTRRRRISPLLVEEGQGVVIN